MGVQLLFVHVPITCFDARNVGGGHQLCSVITTFLKNENDGS